MNMLFVKYFFVGFMVSEIPIVFHKAPCLVLYFLLFIFYPYNPYFVNILTSTTISLQMIYKFILLFPFPVTPTQFNCLFLIASQNLLTGSPIIPYHLT